MTMQKLVLSFAVFLIFIASLVVALNQEPLGIAMESYPYPHPVHYLDLIIGNEKVKMAYMDVQTSSANSKTILLLHGKNFFGAYWTQVIKDLSENGYRVIAPDQVGFGKSSKPVTLQYTFHLLATNTRKLLDHLGVSRTHVLGHSMGGMLAIRFALMYPEVTEKLILENPIGLEDYRTKVPYQTVDQLYEEAFQVNREKLRDYQRNNYYHGTWKEEYEKWVEPVFRMSLSPEYPRLARISALTSEMIYTQPVCYEWSNLRMPTLLLIGQLDRTAIGKNLVTEEVRKTLGNYPELGRRLAGAIPQSQLIELANTGHIPHIESYSQFLQPLLHFLGSK